MKYAIVPINFKWSDEDKLLKRCVLIEYKDLKDLIYNDTRIIDKDPYFKDENKALQYKFEDDGYTLLKDNYGISTSVAMIKRPYHNHLVVDSYLFECDTDEEAINKFKNHEYYNK